MSINKKSKLKSINDWWRHFFWISGRVIINFFKMDYHNMINAWYWLRIHIEYKSKRIK